jgi:hypothetical protein
MIETLKPFGVGQYHNSIGLLCFMLALAGRAALFTVRFLARAAFGFVFAGLPAAFLFARAIASLPVKITARTSHQLGRAPPLCNRCSVPETRRASARLSVSPTPSVVIRNRGAAEQSLRADFPVTRTGPYDAIFDS